MYTYVYLGLDDVGRDAGVPGRTRALAPAQVFAPALWWHPGHTLHPQYIYIYIYITAILCSALWRHPGHSLHPQP